MPDEDEIKLYRKIASGSAHARAGRLLLEAIGITLDSKRFGELVRVTPERPGLMNHWTNSTLGRVPLATAIPSSRKTTARPFWQRVRVWSTVPSKKAGNRVVNAGLRGKDRPRG